MRLRTTTIAAAVAALVLTSGLASPATAAVDDRADALASAAVDEGDYDWFFADALGGSSRFTVQDFGSQLFGDFPLVCDATRGGDRPAVWSEGRFLLDGGRVDISFGRGDGSDYPLCGDWDGDGVDTPGVVRGNQYFLARSNVDGGGGSTSFSFGSGDDFPLVGDWDGNGTDTIAVVRGNQFIAATANVNGGGGVRSSSWGSASDFPIAGDWDGNGRDDIALQRGSTFFVSTGAVGTRLAANRTFVYGRPTDYPVAGTITPGTRGSIGLVRVES